MKRVYSEKLYLLLVFIASYYFTSLWFELNYEFKGAPWYELTAQTANTPFQYRMLVPWIVSLLLRFCPAAAENTSAYSKCFYNLYFWIDCASVFAMVLALRQYLGLFLEKRLTDLISFSIFLVLPYNFLLNRWLALRYPTDFPSILFFTLGLTLIYRRKWSLFYPLFILATFNRETTCFLTAAYILTAIGYGKRKTVLLHALAQALSWLAVKYVLSLIYAANAGGNVCQFHLIENFGFLTTIRAYALFFSNLGYLWIPVLFYWKLIPDQFVRRTVWLIPIFFLGMFFVGNMYELRIYGELTPVVISAFALILKEMFTKEGVLM